MSKLADSDSHSLRRTDHAAAVKLAGGAVQGVLAMTAFTVIQIVTSIFQKLSLGKASKVPEVTENSRRPSDLTCDDDAECGQQTEYFTMLDKGVKRDHITT
ncbi:hypothetical protein [Mesorhizobium sp. M0006]|uniref:hypothetical protein n=1 Tax=Mesorhizobium sp. M0006 TaxID=2956838 RepID=UPI00333C3A39